MKLVQVPAVVALTLVPPPAVVAPVISDDHDPKVFNACFLKRLGALNRVVRRLRALGLVPAAIHLQGERPSIQVDAKAKPLLVTEGNGYSSLLIEGSTRLCKIVLDECDVTWYEAQPQ